MELSGKINEIEVEFDEFIANLPVMLLIHINGRIVNVNSQALEFIGYSKDELSYLEYIIDEDSLPILKEKLAEREKGIAHGEYEIKTITKSGKRKKVLVNPSFIKYKGQKAVLVVFKDVTEKEELEARISYERDHLLSLMKSMPDACIYFKDLQSRFTMINETEAKLLGAKSPEEAIGKTDFDYFQTNHSIEAFNDEKKIMQTGIPQISKLEKHTRRDRIIWLTATKAPIYNKEGKVIGLVGISHDVTQLKQIEEEITKSEELFRSVWENSFDGMSLIDKDNNIVMVNNSYCNLVDKKNEELIGRDFSLVFSEEYRPVFKKRINEFFETHSLSHLEYKIKLWNGKTVWLDISITFLYLEKDSPLLLSIYRNITERKRIEDKLTYRTEMEMLVTTISTAFIHYSTDEIDNGINITLSSIGSFFEADRCYIFQISGNNKFLINKYEWCDKGIESQKQIKEKFDINEYPWVINKLKQSEFIYISNVQTLENLSPSETDFFNQRALKSLILVPMVFAKELKGFLGLDFVRKEMVLQEEDITMFENISDIIIFSLERKRAHEALELEKEDLSITLRSITDGVITTDPKGEIVFFNKAAEDIFGWSVEELSGNSLNDLFNLIKVDYNIDKTTFTEEINLNKNDSSITTEYQAITSKDGKKKILFTSSTEVLFANKKLRGYVYFIRDLTEKVKLEEQLSLSQKMESIGFLAAGIAHEINTPMQYISDNTTFIKNAISSITGFLSCSCNFVQNQNPQKNCSECYNFITEKRKNDDIDYLLSEIPLAIEQTQTGIEKVSKIVLAMKDFSHPSIKSKIYSDLNHAIEVTSTISRNEWKYVSDLDLKLAPDLPIVNCVIDEINQVILNMIVNAAQAVEEKVGKTPVQKGKITISTANLGKLVEIKITDNGAGIAKNNIPKIFAPFFTTKPIGKGTGQGLSIAHDIIVNKHNGKILVESEINKGTTFIIQLPVNG